MRPLLLALLLSSTGLLAGETDIVIADFEGQDYGAWKADGEAFGTGPARGTLPGQMKVTGFKGKGLANSFNKGDGTTGTLTSPSFKIERPFINFLIGGGKHDGKTCMNLLIDGQVVRTATGPNDQPGGSEALAWQAWDVKDLNGKTATLQIVDQATGGWGHINVDQIVQSEHKKETVPVERSIAVEKPYLHLPVKNGAPVLRVRYEVDGKWVREFTIELAMDEPDYWVFSDVSAFKGKTLKITAPQADGPEALAAIRQADEIPGAETLYREKLRPQFHFSSRVGWLNDPNGLVYHKGEYHLFYQHNPYGWKWGNMHWAHAVSPDLVHWKELPIAIYPFQWNDWVFSGSAVIDADNTAGFKQGDEDVMVAAYTSTGRGECIAYSRDRGRTFTDYEGNPVVKHHGRDPKVIWYAPGKHWVMAVYDELEKKQWIAFHTSTDLKTWTYQSRIEGYYECPEIFELPMEGEAGKTRWIVYAADGQYSIGTFDGKTFTTESGKHPLSRGKGYYASQTYNGTPDGRRIQIGWGQYETRGMPFNQCMLFPAELTLRKTEEGLRVFVNPAREIEKLHAKKHAQKDLAIPDGETPVPEVNSELLDIRAEFEVGDAKQVGLIVRGTPLTWDAAKSELEFRGCRGPLKPEGGKISLRVLVDRTTTEIYANGGRVYMPVGGTHPDDKRGVAVFARGGAAKLTNLEVHELKSAWE